MVWTFHALTANSNPEEWWEGLFSGDGMYAHWDVICVNMLGSPYGSGSPLTHGGMSFPLTTIRDTVKAQLAVACSIEHPAYSYAAWRQLRRISSPRICPCFYRYH